MISLSISVFEIKKGILQRGSLSPLPFAIFIVPLTQIFRKIESEYTLKHGEKLNHLLFMDELKTFAKSDHEVNGLVSTVHIVSKHNGVELASIEKMGSSVT